MKWRGARDELGQMQILGASVLGTAILATALFGLQYALQNRISAGQNARRSEIKAALDIAAKQALYMYQGEAACVPDTFDAKLSRMTNSGSAPNDYVRRQRQLNLDVNGKNFVVSFGRVTVAQGDPNAAPGAQGLPINPQDAVVEIWTSMSSLRQGVRTGVRVSQRVALLNNCSTPCASRTVLVNNPNAGMGTSRVVAMREPPGAAELSDPCLVQQDAGVAYHWITNAQQYPANSRYIGMPAPANCTNNWLRGQVAYWPGLNDPLTLCDLGSRPTSNGQATSVGINDLMALRNYIRSGDPRGTCQAIVAGSGGTPGCGDLNGDGVIDVQDVGLLEKYLRGYVYWIPAH